MAYRKLILAIFMSVCEAYIVSIGNEHECITIVCENSGKLQNETCTCACDWEYTGFFCETKVSISEWPLSEYSIPMSSFGCPEAMTSGWDHGYINMTNSLRAPIHLWNFNMTYDDIHYNKTIYPKPNILGPFYKHSIQHNFCSKREYHQENSVTKSQWGEGKYCILKSGLYCPDGFKNGSIRITGYAVESHDVGGHLPDIDIFNSSITLKFCCRDDGDISKPMTLPTSFPFNLYLGPTTDECQKVKYMEVQKDVFYMTDIDQSWSFNGLYPSLDVSSYEQRIGIPYCYYKPNDRKECYYKSDNGNSYNGRVNISETGKPCLPWRTISPEYLNSWKWFGEFEENFCRGYWGSNRPHTKPQCIVHTNGTEETCSIPLCYEDPDLQIYGANKPFYNIEGSSPENAVDGSFWWFPVTLRFIGTYVSKYQWDFMNYGALRCDDLRLPRKNKIFRFQCKRPITGQYISLRNFDHMDPDENPWRYFYMSLTEVAVHGKRTNCGRPLGMITGNIYSYQIDASSVLQESVTMYISHKGRLLNPGVGWCSDPAKDRKPWFSVDLITPRRVQGLLLQGWYEGVTPRLIRKFTISYGVRRNELRVLEDPTGIKKIFRLDQAIPASSIQRIMFANDIMARWIQINPISEVGEKSCLKLEVIGCALQAHRDVFCRHDKNIIDFGFATVRYQAWWMDDYLYTNITLPINDNSSCYKLCLERNCVSFFQNRIFDPPYDSCTLHTSHRFQQEHHAWWVQDMPYEAVASHRLCFKRFSPIEVCSHSLKITGNATSTILSPGFPLMYEQGLNCTWEITTEENRYIKLKILHVNLAKIVSRMTLIQNGVYDVNPGSCNDTLIILDNSLGKKEVITDDDEQEYTDSILISSNNTLTIHFLSCFQLSAQEQNNFKIIVSSVDFPGCGMVGTEYSVRCLGSTAYIANNRFPARYKESVEMWSIEGVFGQYIQFEFIHLDVVDLDALCSKSYVAIYDTDIMGEEHLIGRYCKLKRPFSKILSNWQKMRIEFRSDTSRGGRGFLGKYSMIDHAHRLENRSNNDCEMGWYGGGDSCYKLGYATTDNKTISTKLTWITSEKLCLDQGSHLVSINNPSEMEIIHSLLTTAWDLNGNTDFFIGLHKNADATSFSWTDGSPLTYTAWYVDSNTKTSQPDGFANEQCTCLSLQSIHTTDNWNDIACAYDQIYSYICEKNSTTTVKDDMHDQLLNMYGAQNMDHNVHFICTNHQLISRLFLCDGKNDCGDASDELDCDIECNEDQFQCDNGACISLGLYCDFVPHCDDASEESRCVRRSCSANEWRCSNNQCIPIKQRCDLQENCIDGSDEKMCSECNENSYQCYDQRCLPPSLLCDGFIDCTGRFFEDERHNCQENIHKSCTEWWSLGKRSNGEYLINMGHSDTSPALVECEFEHLTNNIIVKTRVHHLDEEMIDSILDGIHVNLKYNADDTIISSLKESADCSQAIRVRCYSIFDKKSLQWTAFNGDEIDLRTRNTNCSCPFVNNCASDFGRCNCNSTKRDWRVLENNIKLEDSGIITNEEHLPIKRIDSINGESHKTRFFELEIGPLECKQTLFVQSVSFLCRNSVTISANLRCLLDFDRYGGIIGCRDLSHLDDCETFICPAGFVKCKDSFCIPIRLMCDSTIHCGTGEDEQYCDNVTCKGLFKCRESNICLEPNKVCDGYTDCPTFDDELLCFEQCPFTCKCTDRIVKCVLTEQFNISDISLSTRKLDLSASHFENALPDFNNFSSLAELNISFCKIRKINSYHFKGLNNLLSLDLSVNMLETIVANTFDGLVNLKNLSLRGNIYLFSIEPFAFYGLQNLPYLEITETKLQHIFTNTFAGLSNAKHINLSHNDIQWVDNNAFHPLKKILELDLKYNNIKEFSSQIFKGLDSLHKLQTDDYVFCCLKPSSVSDENCFPQRDEFSSCTDLMRNDMLRWCLWIIGIFALLGNVVVLVYRFVFDRQTLKKGHGLLIANLSISDFCMGIYLLIIASADTYFRGQYVWNDRSWRRGSVCKFAGVMSTVSSECSVIFLCFITIDRILAVKFPFGQYCFTKKKALYATTIAWVVVILTAIAPLCINTYFNDEFYSRSAVCLALPLTRDKPSGWEYGTAVFIVLNFVIFIIIAIGQLIIYKEVAMAVDTKFKTQRKQQDLVIARGLFIVMFTDFICWFPVGVMGLMALTGYIVPGEVYALTAVFILPVNSALNPFLYTFSALRRGQLDFTSKIIEGLMALTGYIVPGEVYALTAVFILPVNSALNPFLYTFSALRRGQSKKKLGNKSIKTTSGTNQTYLQIGWEELMESDKFILGKRMDNFYTLADHMQKYKLNTMEMIAITKGVVFAVVFLHQRGIKLGPFHCDDIVLEKKDGKVGDVKMKIFPKNAIEEIDLKLDMFEVGQLVKMLLRGPHRQLCN